MLDVIAELIKLTLSQGQQIKMMALVIAGQSCLIEPSLVKCVSCKKSPQTVKHKILNVELCDRCAAETIVKANRSFLLLCKTNPKDPFVNIVGSMMDETAWADIDDSDRIRRVTDYAKFNQEIDVRSDQVH